MEFEEQLEDTRKDLATLHFLSEQEYNKSISSEDVEQSLKWWGVSLRLGDALDLINEAQELIYGI